MTTADIDIELYEHEMQKIEALLRQLQARIGDWITPDAFAREVTERFEDIGFVVDVIMGVSEVATVNKYSWNLRFIGRIDPVGGEFDHERQAAEIQTAEGGRITGSGLWRPN